MSKQIIELPAHLRPPPAALTRPSFVPETLFTCPARAPVIGRGRLSANRSKNRPAKRSKIYLRCKAAGARWQDVVKSTVHLSDLRYFPRDDAVYAEMVPAPRPVRTTGADILVEIDVFAYAPSQ